MSQTAPHPERHMQTRCGGMVEKGHVGYPCSRPQGHTGVPIDDPEPCYAVEVPVSLRTWQAWKQRQQEQTAPPVVHVQPLDPAAQLAAVHAQPEEPPAHPAEFLVNVFAKHCDNFVAHEPHVEPNPEGVDHYCDGTGIRPEYMAPQEPGPFEPTDLPPMEPTKQREGDQPLPLGDPSLQDDQSLVMADIAARRNVGIERYGQAHVPFNGRNTMLDSYEEILDFLVYQRSLLRLREATKAELAEVLQRALQQQDVNSKAGVPEALAEVLADWALMQRVGNSPQYAYSGELRDRRANLAEVDPGVISGIELLAGKYGLLGVLSVADQMFEESYARLRSRGEGAG